MAEEAGFDLFWRNPFNYWRQMQQIGETNIAWDRGMIGKTRIDPFLFSSIKFQKINPNWRCYVVGRQNAQEYDASCSSGRPKANYPVFDWAEHDLSTLEFYLKNPWGQDPTMYTDESTPIVERPVRGQQHKVFITNLPPLNCMEGRQAIAILEEINRRWKSHCQIFIHRVYGFANLFGREFTAGSFDGREEASHGRIQLVNGRKFDPRISNPEDIEPFLRQFGYKFTDLESASERCMFNMRSALYASNHYVHQGRPLKRVSRGWVPSIDVPDTEAAYPSPKD